MSDLVKKLRSQIGDDVAEIYDHDALFRLASNRIEELEQGLLATLKREHDANASAMRFKRAIIWARDRVDVEGGMTAPETWRTSEELLNVLRGMNSEASSYTPEGWQSPTLRDLEQNKPETRISGQSDGGGGL
jgi:hypothetical protein